MFPRPLALAAALIATTVPLAAQPSPLDVYVSTGDNHFLGSSLPIDSPASVEATFDLFKNVNHARRVYWRGLEEANWISTMHARPENPRYHSLWRWLEWLYANVKPDELAVKAAHARGMEIWGVGSLWDWGSPADTPTFGDYPFPFESKLKLEHPEWAPVDRDGVRRQGGPIELAYPEARRALVDLIVRDTRAAGYDGITFLTYVENYSLRFQDEFGYSEPIVRDFKKLHGIDLTRELFKRGATREDWLRLRGSYVTAFLRELKAALLPHGIKLGMIVNPNDPHAPLPWNVPEMMLTAGSHHLDVETWVRDGLVDALCVYGNSSPLAQRKTLADLRFLARGTACEVSFMTSSPFGEAWSEVQKEGVPTVLAVSDDAQHLARGFIPEQPIEALKGDDLWKRLRVLEQVSAGKLTVSVENLVPLTTSPHLIERRMALEALGKTGNSTAITAALADAENGVRCAAALALGQRRDPAAAANLLNAVEQHGNHMLVECAVIALRRLQPLPVAALSEAALRHPQARVREVAGRALQPFADAKLLPVFAAALGDAERFTRYVAAESLGNIRKSPAAAEALLPMLQHADPTTASRAALSIGMIGQRGEAELAPLRPRLLEALQQHFVKACGLDDGWTFRPAGNALRIFGDEGERVLRELRDGTGEMRVREAAWRVLDLHQQPNTFSEVTPEQDRAAQASRPRAGVASAHEIHVDPVAGNDANDGRARSVKSIARGIRLAQPGDTVHLARAHYFESIDLSGKLGTAAQPITVDGHDSILDGSEPVLAKDWEALGDGLYRKVKLLPRTDDAIVGRWFFLWDGRMNRMGRTSKGPSAPLKKAADLAPGEWTYVKDEDAFYVRIAEPTLDAAKLRYPLRSSGVIMAGKGAHLRVRNVISTHVYNDGFNIHGAQRACVFENIAAIECGDDGFSAHEDAECAIDGFVSIGNSTGVTDTVSSVTHYKNVFIRDCHGFDLYFIGDSPHSIDNAVVESSAARAVDVSQHGDRPQTGTGSLRLKNVLIRRAGKPQEIRVNRNAELWAERCTFIGLNVLVTSGGVMTARESIFTGEPKPEFIFWPNTVWRGDGNRFGIQSLRVDRTTYTGAKFAEFQRATGTDASSTWGPPAASDTAGVDDPALVKVREMAVRVERRWRAGE